MKSCTVQIATLLPLLLQVADLMASDSPILFIDKRPDATITAPLIYWQETTDNPRPLKIHCLRIDLKDPDFEVFTMVSEDPDGKGPAEAGLDDPLALAERNNAIAAVNANGFQSIGPGKSGTDNNWYEGRPIHIVGVAITNMVVRNKSAANHFAFWLDKSNNPNLGIPESDDTIKEAISEWSGLLVLKGKIIAMSREKLHPRTLLGFDATKRWLLLVVVDGRHSEISEGMNLQESARYMKQIGCFSAIALDGGGSSTMLLTDPEKSTLRVINRPAEGKPSPIPVMIGVRRKN